MQNISHVMFVTAYTNQNSGYPLQEECGGLEVPEERSVHWQMCDKSTFSLGRVTSQPRFWDLSAHLLKANRQKKIRFVYIVSGTKSCIYESEEIQKKEIKRIWTQPLPALPWLSVLPLPAVLSQLWALSVQPDFPVVPSKLHTTPHPWRDQDSWNQANCRGTSSRAWWNDYSSRKWKNQKVNR